MHFPFKKILCPVGFDDQERAALDAAKQLAGGFATVYLLHVVERILVDHSQPAPKQEWASFHDVTHRVLEWHRPYFLGDTATTLDPDNPLALSG
jgi:hypothetical protein